MEEKPTCSKMDANASEVEEIKTRTQSDLDRDYERLSRVQQQANEEYKEAYNTLINKLSIEHFAPIAHILGEREKLDLNIDINEFRTKVLDNILERHSVFWNATAAPGITSLEMLKEASKDYEGHDWNLQNKSPEQVILPLRMGFAEIKLCFLNKQLAAQQILLNKKIEEVDKHREMVGTIMKYSDIQTHQAREIKTTVPAVLNQILESLQETDQLIRNTDDEFGS